VAVTASLGATTPVEPRPLAAPGPAAAIPTATAPPPADPTDPPAPTPEAPLAAPASGWKKTTGLVTAGVAVVALGVGTVQWVSKERNFGKFNDPDNGCGLVLPDLGGSQCQTWRKDGKHAKTLGLAGFIAGGVLGAAAAGLLLWHANGTETAGRTTFACAPGAGLACRLTW
jgi:hypothetical protein